MAILHGRTPRMLVDQQILLYSIALVMPEVSSAPSATSPSQNSTIPPPEGTFNHGIPNLLCTPSTWSNVATFFLANYIAHAATVKIDPGQPMLLGFWSMLLALILPTFGAYKGLDAIRRCAIFGSSPLQKAKKAGALCEVVRTQDWTPQPGLDNLVQRAQYKPIRDEHNLTKIKMLLESRKRRVATKLSWLTRREVQLDKFLPGVVKLGNRLEDQVIGGLDQLLRGVKTLLRGEGRLVRWWFYAEIIFNTPLSRKANSLEMSDLSGGLKRTTPPRVIPSPKIRIEGLHGRGRFKPSHKMLGLVGRNIHGLCCLPPGYELSIVHSDAAVLELNDDKNSESQTVRPNLPTSIRSGSSVNSDISWSYSFTKGLIAFFQALYACATLYDTRGDQIECYGYAAFGLTVAPYLVMSIINLIGTVLTPDYSTVFMVESEIMEEARQREGAFFSGAVGKLVSDGPNTLSFNATFKVDDQNQTVLEITDGSGNAEGTPQVSTNVEISTDESPIVILPACHDALKDACRVRDLFVSVDTRLVWNASNLTYLATAVGLISVGINGVLSHFRSGESTHAQRAWTMMWLAVGVFYGGSVASMEIIMTSWTASRRRWAWILAALSRSTIATVYCVPAIGGFVVVGQMLMNYGHCIRIGGESS